MYNANMRKTILVVGGSSKLGKYICTELLQSGHTVYASYNSTPILKSKRLFPIKLDTTSDQSCKSAIKRLTQRTRQLDAVIYVTGISPKGSWDTFNPTDLSKVLEVNTVGAFRLAKCTVPWLKKTKGKLVFVSSLSGIASFPNFSIYSASKFALRALSTSLYHELSKTVNVSCIFPGAIDYHDDVRSSNSARDKIALIKFLMPMVPVETLVKKITRLLSDQNPPAEIFVGRDVLIISLLLRLLPVDAWYHLQQFVWSRQK